MVALQEAYQPGDHRWHHHPEIRYRAGQYYQCLRRVLKAYRHARGLLTRCQGCGIFMLTSPSNRGRDDLRCPMGCRGEHARLERNRLSSEYYRTPEGREKKKELNKNRKDSDESSRPDDGGSEIDRDADLESYLKSILPIIEGRAVDQEEIQSLIQRSRDELRQYSLGKEEKTRILPDE